MLTRRRFLNLSIASAAGATVLSPYLLKRILAQESATPCGPSPGQLACHCPGMIARRQGKFVDACVKESETKEKYIKCLGNMPPICEMLEHPDRDEDGNLPPHDERRSDSRGYVLWDSDGLRDRGVFDIPFTINVHSYADDKRGIRILPRDSVVGSFQFPQA